MAMTKRFQTSIGLVSVSALAIVCALGVQRAGAQTAPNAASLPPGSSHVNPPGPSTTLEEVVVTARKRNEKLLSVPIAITAFTSKSLKKRGIYSITDLANHTPGLSVDNTVNSSGRSDRSFPLYVLRGINPSLTTNPTVTVFLDGAPLIGGAVDNLENLERVEVLKGPQAAYFGRETFAGAISLVTKDPSPTPRVSIDSLIASGNWYDNTVGVEGPIIPGKLSFSGSFRDYSRQGSYSNAAVADKTNERLGDQSTKSGTFKIVVTPNPDLKVSVLGLYFHDDDGPSAEELIVPGQSDCLGFWFCGQVPDRLGNQPAVNDLVTPQVQNLLNKLGSPSGNQMFKPLSNKFGLVRDAYHGSVNVDYNINAIDATLSSLTAVDNQRFSELQDLANDDGSGMPNLNLGAPGSDPNVSNTFATYPFFVEAEYRSLSQEIRLTSSENQRFRWLAGFNYEYTRTGQSLGGGNGYNFYEGSSPDTSNTISGFYGLAYDITPALTVDFDGRVQSVKESTSPFGTSTQISGTYNNFLPRVSLQYKFTPKIMSYITYSEGINPGTFNGSLLALPSAEQTVLAQEYNAKVKVEPEQLTNYEIGTKGSFFGDTLQISADIYYDIWYRQININAINFFNGPVLENTSVYTNDGRTDLNGIEADADWEPIPGLLLNGSGAINNSKIIHGGCQSCLEQIGTTNVNGKSLPDVSKFQATIGAEYDGNFGFLANTSLHSFYDWGYFGRADYIYKSPSYEDRDNLVYTPSENLLNIRAGITRGPLSIEVFADNLTNWGGPTSLAGFVNLGSNSETYAHTSDSLLGGLPYLRSFGLRLHYSFGL